MTIALFASAFHPSVGGVEELCRQLAHAYRRQGVGAVVLTNRWPRSLPAFEEHQGIPVYRLAMRVPDGRPKAHLSYWLTHRAVRRRTLSILRQHRCSIAHVQCVSCNALYALWAKQLGGLPLVVTLQGELGMDAGDLFAHSAYARSLMRTVLDEADAVTACSAQTLREAEDFRNRPFDARGRVIYNGVRCRDVQSARPFDHLRPYILSIGRHVTQKGFDVLIRAYAALLGDGLVSHDLIIAGDGVEHQELIGLAQELQIGGRIVFTGRVDHETALELFAGCAFFVLPSRQEPMGIVNLEAMAAGKAVIASRVGGVPEILTDGEAGILVAAANVSELSSAMKRLIDHPHLAERLGETGRRHAAAFDWDSIAMAYTAVYESISPAFPAGAPDDTAPLRPCAPLCA